MTNPAAPAGQQQVKSGIRTLKPGDILFNENDHSDSLFIIQKGQVRLYRPKGKGFIELAVLRSGEVIGEMAYFDEDGTGRKRSCSAAALTTTEVIEISFVAFGKTMSSLNPWFKTIINTLVTRLRKTNSRVRELEDNQTNNYGKGAGYEFFKSIEVMRILGTMFLVFKAHGETKAQAMAVNRKTLTLYTQDMYQISEAKLESMISLLGNLGWMEVANDDEKMPNLLLLKNMDLIRQIFIFYNSERHLPEEKKMRISDRAEAIIAKMLEKLPANPMVDIPNLKIVDDVAPKFTKYYNLTPVIEDFKARNQSINVENLEDGKNVGLFGEVLMKDGVIYVEADITRIQKLYPVIRFMNAVRKLNAEKAGG